MVLLSLVVAVTALCMNPVVCIPLHQFIGYPFEDVATFPSVDDDFLTVNLAVPFRLGTTDYENVHINNNGMLSFERPTSAFTPVAFPVQGEAYVSPYWGDVDTRMSDDSECDGITNAVYLKEYVRGPEENAAILQSISATVTSSSAYQNTTEICPRTAYEAQWAYVVSWIQVGYYSTHCDKHNSFQAILTTNGVQSFAVFNYGEIQWATGDASGGSGGFGGEAALVGINAADGSYTVHPNSLTDAIANIDTEPGNVNSILGQWVYRTDANSSGTNTGIGQVPLTLAPLSGHVLGGTPIYSFGRCLSGVESVRCSFGGQEVTGEVLPNGQILCVSPEMASFGRVSVTLQITFGQTGESPEEVTFYAASPDVAYGVTYMVSNLEQDGHTLRQGETIEIRWSTDIMPHREDTSYEVDVLLYRRDEESGSLSQPIPVALGEFNDGSATVTIPSVNWPADDVIIPVFLQVTMAARPSEDRVGKWAPVAFLVMHSDDLNGTECNRWAESDPIDQQLLQDTVCCPLTAQSARWRTSGLTEVTGINRDLHTYYNPMADTCFRQTAARQGTTAGQQCCYRADGSLHTGPSGGGSVDSHVLVDMETFWNHQIHDVAPNILCCKEIMQCATYFQRRPSNGGCVLRPPACVYGDPHIVTLDGHKYTFNGKGEYILIATEDNSFTLQGRMVEAPSSNGSTTNRGTVFSALAAKQSDSDTVQFQLTDNLVPLVNRVAYTFEEVEEELFANVIVRKEENGSFSATFSSGVYLEVRLANNSNSGPYISTVIVSLPESFTGQTRGLMGNYNGDTSDDLVPRLGGDPLPLNSSLETLHWDFGITWIINSINASLFSYDGSSFDDFHDPLFTPVFEAVFSDPDLQAVAEEMCQGDVYCLFDIAATGDATIGLTTLIGVQELDEMVDAARPVVCSPPCSNGACVANDTCSCSEGYTGERCVDVITFPCASNACGIGGSCSILASTLSCSCRHGYSGQFCETGPSLDGLTPDAEMSFDNVARNGLERLLNVWGVANVALDSFSFEQLSVGEGYSFVVDSGSWLYKLDLRPASTPGNMGLNLTRY